MPDEVNPPRLIEFVIPMNRLTGWTCGAEECQLQNNPIYNTTWLGAQQQEKQHLD